MKTLLICHDGALLDQEGLARWLASFSMLAGIIILRERKRQFLRRVRREVKRTGGIRFLDVLAFRAYYRLFLAKKDEVWKRQNLEELRRLYPQLPRDTPVLYTPSPNSPEAEQLIKSVRPDIMLARCKFLLKESIFSIPSKGTLVMHPGICPEYRNAHGCFWALANGDLDKVGMTLLRIDRGIDTGPIFGYYTYPYDESSESHVVIQHRVVLENLDRLREKLLDVYAGCARSVDTSGRPSAAWGQPWLTSYLKIKRRPRNRNTRSDTTIPESASRAGGHRDPDGGSTGTRPRVKVIAILFHDVVNSGDHESSGFPGAGAARYKIPPEEFRKHLAAIAKARNTKPVTAFDLSPTAEKEIPFLLTFDDGGASAHTCIADLIESYGWRGHFLITTNYIGARSFVSQHQIRALRNRGHIIGSHSCSHPEWMSSCSRQELVTEWGMSVKVLSEILGEQVSIASVPRGHYSRKVAQAAAEVGIKTLFNSEPTTTCETVEGCTVVGRYTIFRGMSPATTAGFAAGHWFPQLKQWSSWKLKSVAKSFGSNGYLKIRTLLLKRQ